MAGRKTLSHDAPPWVDPAKEIWFVSISCQPRGLNQLAQPKLWPMIAESIQRRVDAGIWWVHLFLAMPDHCHALVSFPPTRLMKNVVADWKRWLATQYGVRWQTDFFDHRLRRDESFEEKSRYILDNPVNAGLVERVEDWPYVWQPESQSPFTRLHRK